MSTEQYNPAPLTNQQIAENTVKQLSASELIEMFASLLNKVDDYKTQLAKREAQGSQLLAQRDRWRDTVTDFIKKHIKEDEVTVDDLKELAEELEIKLTKSIKVTFAAVCEYEFDVPIDFDNDDITDRDFSIRISSDIQDENIEETSESMEVEDFEVEDND
jgi:sugar-specific transcriptional regulator TrmB